MSYFSKCRIAFTTVMSIVAPAVMFQVAYAQPNNQPPLTGQDGGSAAPAAVVPATTTEPSVQPQSPVNADSGVSSQPSTDISPIADLNRLFSSTNIETIVVANDIKDLLSSFARCSDLKGSVVEYQAAAPDNGKIWMTSSATGFCRVAVQPRGLGKPVVCNISMQDVAQVLTKDNLALINQIDPKKSNLDETLIEVAKPLLDCYKQAAGSVASPTGAVPPSSTTGVTSTPSQAGGSPAEGSSPDKKPDAPQTYDYSKMLQSS